MRSVEDVAAVESLLAEGLNDCEISRRTGIPRSTVRGWRHGARTTRSDADASCADCGHPVHDFDDLPDRDYAYLLGLYLGDGCISHLRRGVYGLRVTLDAKYPLIIDECAAAMQAVIGKRPGRTPAPGCVVVQTYSKSWPCFFPQHGPGPKHHRSIALTYWQQQIADREPEALVRGLIQSDGWRGMNRVKVRGKRYAYPRYQFCNVSDDIREIFTYALDDLGIEWRTMNARNISVAKRASVARLDEFVGPKA